MSPKCFLRARTVFNYNLFLTTLRPMSILNIKFTSIKTTMILNCGLCLKSFSKNDGKQQMNSNLDQKNSTRISIENGTIGCSSNERKVAGRLWLPIVQISH